MIFSAFLKILKRKLSLKFYIFLIEKNTFQNKISCLLKALQYVPNQREQLKFVYGKINVFLFCCLKWFKLEIKNQKHPKNSSKSFIPKLYQKNRPKIISKTEKKGLSKSTNKYDLVTPQYFYWTWPSQNKQMKIETV